VEVHADEEEGGSVGVDVSYQSPSVDVSHDVLYGVEG
jgi:hypothetical protein